MKLILIAALACVGVLPALGEPEIVFKKKGAEPELVDSARYSRSSREFSITKGAATFGVPENDVEYCRPPKPQGFDTQQSIPELEKIVTQYRRLWWDAEAFTRLMPLYLDKGENKKAIGLFRDMRSSLGETISVSIRRLYWEALRNDGQLPVLDKELSETVKTASREASAWAYVMRGDLLERQDKRKEALVDGYLKALIMFQDVTSCRKEALEKTVKVMEALGDSRTRQFRKELEEQKR